MAAKRKSFLELLVKKLNAASEDLVNEDVSYDQIVVTRDHMDKLWESFRLIEYDMLDKNEEEEMRERFEKLYLHSKAISLRLEREKNPHDHPPQNLNNIFMQQNNLLQEIARINHGPKQDIRLPQLNICEFHGDSDKWVTFRDQFKSAIHDNEKISKINKFQYLTQYLKGKAQYLLSDMTPSDAQYDEAWRIVCERYDNTKYIINSFIQKFISQSAIQKVNGSNLRQIVDKSEAAVRGIDVLGQQARSRDPWLIYFITQLLDPETKLQWAEEIAVNDFPKFEEFLVFLKKRCVSLETSQSFQMSPKPSSAAKVKSLSSEVQPIDHQPHRLCLKCNGEHYLFACDKFKSMNSNDRRKFALEKQICFNCLKAGHSQQRCRSRFACHKCRRHHHTLLHPDNLSSENPSSSSNVTAMHCDAKFTASRNIPHPSPSLKTPHPSINTPQPVPSSVYECSAGPSSHSSTPVLTETVKLMSSINDCSPANSLLPTVVFHVTDLFGNFQPCRALLDSGSQANFITESCVQRLALRRSNAKFHISGVASSEAGYTKGKVTFSIIPRQNQHRTLEITALVLPRLTSSLPPFNIDISDWEYISKLSLADPSFNKSNEIDIIIGSSNFFDIILSGQVMGPSGFPLARETIFGWLVTGQLPHDSNSAIKSFNISIDIDSTLRKFWEVEEVPVRKMYTEEEKACETHFVDNTTKSEEGRISVRLPFKPESPELGNSFKSAMSRLQAMERKFRRNPNLKTDYSKFIDEYQSLGHMELVPVEERAVPENRSFYLPHHAVIKDSSTTTKLRVVFDASAKSSTGVSLNDKLMTGATIQNTMFETLVKFRRNHIAISADIAKMYRQIRVAPEDCDYQRILWRDQESQPVKIFRLLTVTYGLASAPFLAIRSLKQIADDHRQHNPAISDVIENEFYVDDLMTGINDINEAKNLVCNLSSCLESGGFMLRKWKSNSAELLSTIPAENCEFSPLELKNESHSVAILGLKWNPTNDCFTFNVTESVITNETKRGLLSDSSKVYDPMGWISPCTIKLKILLQRLWLKGIGWDDELPKDIMNEYLSLRNEFHHLREVMVPRLVLKFRHKIELHGFSDASEIAYAGVVYLRCESSDGECEVRLVASKTKVAPLKQVSLPRLELLGTLLISRLIKTILCALDVPDVKVFAWTDSTTVLAWLSAPPRRWKTFIGNRTSEILDTIPRDAWHHVPTKSNPADCASRGLLPTELIHHHLWWSGPDFLVLPPAQWPTLSKARLQEDTADVVAEQRSVTICHTVTHTLNTIHIDIITKFSKFITLIHFIAFWFRYFSNHKMLRDDRVMGPLTPRELEEAKAACYRSAQHAMYSSEISCLMKGSPLPKSTDLANLNPFLDDIGLLRVGGRLENAKIPYTTIHQIILPGSHYITDLVLRELHLKNFHAGPTLLTSILRQRFWVVRGRNAIRRTIHRCLDCYRQKAKPANQLMGQLPISRVEMPSRPFTTTGVDYAGPILVKNIFGRSPQLYKGYIALFVCMTTKALHLEFVSSLSTDAFLAAFRRFASRRGLPETMLSDNGSNFIKASKELRELRKQLMTTNHSEFVTSQLARDGVNWQYQPPFAPHFGGLWEAGVKSTKFHLNRVIKAKTLNFEEMTTLLSQIEALLNSRPLCPLSEDIDSFDILTPGHFLVGGPLTSIPEPSLHHISENRLDRWQSVQRMVQGFWSRWKNEYLTTLQQRTKWKTTSPNIHEGSLAIIRDDNVPPTKWPLARVMECIPGKDGRIRVVKIKTQDGTYLRPITKVCILPISE